MNSTHASRHSLVLSPPSPENHGQIFAKAGDDLCTSFWRRRWRWEQLYSILASSSKATLVFPHHDPIHICAVHTEEERSRGRLCYTNKFIVFSSLWRPGLFRLPGNNGLPLMRVNQHHLISFLRPLPKFIHESMTRRRDLSLPRSGSKG